MPIKGSNGEEPVKNWNDDDWSDIIDFVPYSRFAHVVPEMTVYQDSLYIIWQTNSTIFSNGTDYDIVMTSYNGNSWSDIIEVTSLNDLYNDSHPTLAVFENELHIAWSTSKPISSGSEIDILYRNYDGKRWSNISQLTDFNDGKENNYPKLTVFKDNLYLVWISRFLPTNEGRFLARKFDGNVWNDLIEISPYHFGLKRYFDLTIFNEHLYFIWGITDFKNDDDERIFVRGYDGRSFGKVFEISINESDPFPGGHMGSCTPKLISYNNILYAVWYTDRHIIDNGDEFRDGDLLMTVFNGSGWTQPKIISPGNDFGLDSNPSLLIYNNQLNLIFNTNDNTIISGSNVSIVIRSYNGKNWGEYFELTDINDSTYNGLAKAIVFKGEIYVLWYTANRLKDNNWEYGLKMITTNPNGIVEPLFPVDIEDENNKVEDKDNNDKINFELTLNIVLIIFILIVVILIIIIIGKRNKK